MDHEDEDEDGDGDGDGDINEDDNNLENFQERESERQQKITPLNFEVIVVHDLCDHVRMHNHP